MKVLWKYKSGIVSSGKWNDNLWFGEWIDNWTLEPHRRKASDLEVVVGDKCRVALAIVQRNKRDLCLFQGRKKWGGPLTVGLWTVRERFLRKLFFRHNLISLLFISAFKIMYVSIIFDVPLSKRKAWLLFQLTFNFQAKRLKRSRLRRLSMK